jgi:hypothetical protein
MAEEHELDRRGITRAGRAFREEAEDPYYVSLRNLEFVHSEIFSEKATLVIVGELIIALSRA